MLLPEPQKLVLVQMSTRAEYVGIVSGICVVSRELFPEKECRTLLLLGHQIPIPGERKEYKLNPAYIVSWAEVSEEYFRDWYQKLTPT